MELTGKQIRNGAVDAPGQMGTQSADPGPNYTSEIAAAINAAVADSAYQMPVVTPGIVVVDWDSGVAGAAKDGSPS
jgi:hypothetical protein